MEIKTTATRIVYENRWMRVREDNIRLADGSSGIYGVVEKPNFVAVVPLEDDGSIHLVEQWRYPAGARFWEIPQGAWEHTPDADPLAVALGELQEETGLHSGKMTYAGELFQAYGFATQSFHIFLAQALTHVGAKLDHEEQGLITRRFPAATVTAMITGGTIKDATTIAALGLLKLKGLI